MKQYFIDNHSDKLILFFSGWGCDNYEFEHLKTCDDVLILYDYSDFNLQFDFSKYKQINLIAFSAGVFVASAMKFDFKIDKKIAISGNPNLFDEYFGLSEKVQNFLYNLTEDEADDFARNYLVKTEDEYKNFHPSKRSIESCQNEFENLKQMWKQKKDSLKDIYDVAVCGAEDPLFYIPAQKEFYKDKLKIVENARHNLFFRINNYDDILMLNF